MSKSPSRISRILALTFPPLLLAVAFLWGRIYYETRMSDWGFQSDELPISASQTYIEAFSAVITLLVHPIDGLNNASRLALVFLIGVAALVALLDGVQRQFKLISRLRVWLKTIIRHRATRTKLPRFPRIARFFSVFFNLMFVAAVFPFSLFAVAIIILVLIGPPLVSAHMSVARARHDRTYEAWPSATYTDRHGQERMGFLNGCSDHWCAILQDGVATMVRLEQVKQIDRFDIVFVDPTLPLEGRK